MGECARVLCRKPVTEQSTLLKAVVDQPGDPNEHNKPQQIQSEGGGKRHLSFCEEFPDAREATVQPAFRVTTRESPRHVRLPSKIRRVQYL